LVASAFRVLAAISFHNEPLFESDEINDPRSNRYLPAKFNIFELTRTK